MDQYNKIYIKLRQKDFCSSTNYINMEKYDGKHKAMALFHFFWGGKGGDRSATYKTKMVLC